MADRHMIPDESQRTTRPSLFQTQPGQHINPQQQQQFSSQQQFNPQQQVNPQQQFHPQQQVNPQQYFNQGQQFNPQQQVNPQQYFNQGQQFNPQQQVSPQQYFNQGQQLNPQQQVNPQQQFHPQQPGQPDQPMSDYPQETHPIQGGPSGPQYHYEPPQPWMPANDNSAQAQNDSRSHSETQLSPAHQQQRAPSTGPRNMNNNDNGQHSSQSQSDAHSSPAQQQQRAPPTGPRNLNNNINDQDSSRRTSRETHLTVPPEGETSKPASPVEPAVLYAITEPYEFYNKHALGVAVEPQPFHFDKKYGKWTIPNANELHKAHFPIQVEYVFKLPREHALRPDPIPLHLSHIANELVFLCPSCKHNRVPVPHLKNDIWVRQYCDEPRCQAQLNIKAHFVNAEPKKEPRKRVHSMLCTRCTKIRPIKNDLGLCAECLVVANVAKEKRDVGLRTADFVNHDHPFAFFPRHWASVVSTLVPESEHQRNVEKLKARGGYENDAKWRLLNVEVRPDSTFKYSHAGEQPTSLLTFAPNFNEDPYADPTSAANPAYFTVDKDGRTTDLRPAIRAWNQAFRDWACRGCSSKGRVWDQWCLDCCCNICHGQITTNSRRCGLCKDILRELVMTRRCVMCRQNPAVEGKVHCANEDCARRPQESRRCLMCDCPCNPRPSELCEGCEESVCRI
ncbi:hypothetical protein CTRI78_v009963 [Colletotrichum trifolii]|uniref:Uncharacterized protein n=1 Tax=Colletotrichum trifolii TaxID=5466 RepID=A0A4R8QPB1_COLTR|nr:hypothetical protein CTRI78_v009963 [Colletotrichum trifolii]